MTLFQYQRHSDCHEQANEFLDMLHASFRQLVENDDVVTIDDVILPLDGQKITSVAR